MWGLKIERGQKNLSLLVIFRKTQRCSFAPLQETAVVVGQFPWRVSPLPFVIIPRKISIGDSCMASITTQRYPIFISCIADNASAQNGTLNSSLEYHNKFVTTTHRLRCHTSDEGSKTWQFQQYFCPICGFQELKKLWRSAQLSCHHAQIDLFITHPGRQGPSGDRWVRFCDSRMFLLHRN